VGVQFLLLLSVVVDQYGQDVTKSMRHWPGESESDLWDDLAVHFEFNFGWWFNLWIDVHTVWRIGISYDIHKSNHWNL